MCILCVFINISKLLKKRKEKKKKTKNNIKSMAIIIYKSE